MDIKYLEKELKDNFTIIHYNQIGSTNVKIKEFYGKNSIIVVADLQTEGRGRFGKKFESPKGTGLYFSLMIKGYERLQDNLYVTPMVAIAIRRAITHLTGIDTNIKWLNDIYIEDSKVGGILCELYEKSIIIGIGINTSYNKIFEDIKDNNVSSIYKKEPLKFKENLLVEIVRNIDKFINQKSNLEILKEYNNYLYYKFKNVSLKNNYGDKIFGIILGVDEEYRLIIKDNDRVIHFELGEIEVRYKN